MARAFLLTGELPRAEMTLEQLLPHGQIPRSIQERRAAWARGGLALAQHRPHLALRLADELLASAPSDPPRAEGQPIPALLQLRGEASFPLDHVAEALAALESAWR